jgi:hypothetical protein
MELMERWKGKNKIENIEELFNLIEWVKRESENLLKKSSMY